MRFETVCLNDVLTSSFVSNLTDVVLKLSDEVSLLRKNNAVLVEKIDNLVLYSYGAHKTM
jgi:hypothetical protein